jgi:hypothetical protein
MNWDVVCGGSVVACLEANGFNDEPEPVPGTAFLGCEPSANLLPELGAGFDDGERACFVFDHIVAGAEPILLSIDGWAGVAAGGWIGLPLSRGTLDEFAFGFFGGLAGAFFKANGFRLLHVHPSARDNSSVCRATTSASNDEATPFTARLLSAK